jgi:hypothetical protein
VTLARQAMALVLLWALVAYGQGNTFNRGRYNGGSVATKVDPKEWHNKLTITSDQITFDLKDGQKMVALGILVTPLALFGLMHKTRLHFIGIQFQTADNKPSALLLQGDKNNYRAILVALAGVTGKPVWWPRRIASMSPRVLQPKAKLLQQRGRPRA